LKNSIVELYEKEKRREILSYDPISHNFISKTWYMNFSELQSLLFQQAGTIYGIGKRRVYDVWFLLLCTMGKLRSLEPGFSVWSVLLMEAVHLI
jgi:hypothetical protein